MRFPERSAPFTNRGTSMSETTAEMKGKVHGNVIRFDRDLGFSEGQEVMVTVQPLHPATPPGLSTGFAEAERRLQEAWNLVKDLAPGEGLRRAAGAWAEHADE